MVQLATNDTDTYAAIFLPARSGHLGYPMQVAGMERECPGVLRASNSHIKFACFASASMDLRSGGVRSWMGTHL